MSEADRPQPNPTANAPNPPSSPQTADAPDFPRARQLDLLPEDKRNRLIAAALKVFAKCGYEKASAERITREAGISKGLLFHYFGNKEGLFLSLFEHCTLQITRAIAAHFDEYETDFFALIRQMTRLKLEILAEDPNLYPFLLRAWEEEQSLLGKEIDILERQRLFIQILGVYKKVDRHKFIPEASPEMAMDIIRWTAEGFMAHAARSDALSARELTAQFDRYLELFRKRFYKEEFQ